MPTYGPSNATADTFLSKFHNTTNYNSNTVADIAAPFSNVANRALLQFDVSTIPTGAVVSSATIAARIVVSSGPTGNFIVYPVTRQPTFSQCTWNVYSTGNNWTTAGGDYDASFGDTIAFQATATPFDHNWSVPISVQKALTSYRQGSNIILIARCASEAGGGTGTYYVSTIDGVQEATLTVVYTTGHSWPLNRARLGMPRRR